MKRGPRSDKQLPGHKQWMEMGRYKKIGILQSLWLDHIQSKLDISFDIYKGYHPHRQEPEIYIYPKPHVQYTQF